MKRVSMKKINEVLRLHFKLGLSIRQSGKATNTSREVLVIIVLDLKNYQSILMNFWI